MNQDDFFAPPANPPAAVGTGLVALDVVLRPGSGVGPRYWAGGTCGNVLAILAYLGWDCYPITRLGSDAAAARVVEDLGRWGVRSDHLEREETGSTPIIVQRIERTAAGEAVHSFSSRCPVCGARLSGYKAILASRVEAIVPRLGRPRLFFFDRLSRAALLLAEVCRRRGAVVLFEPSGVGDPALFREAVAASHIVKYSDQRLGRACLGPLEGPLLQIETLGRAGLRYRSSLPFARNEDWEPIGSFAVAVVQDTAGCGDWCSAGIAHGLARDGLAGLLQTGTSGLREALRFGQALAAWNCAFDGARGAMYAAGKPQFESAVRQFLAGAGSPSIGQITPETPGEAWLPICTSCRPA
jgi:sugar/nucleoside kinase (ribokinase family)